MFMGRNINTNVTTVVNMKMRRKMQIQRHFQMVMKMAMQMEMHMETIENDDADEADIHVEAYKQFRELPLDVEDYEEME